MPIVGFNDIKEQTKEKIVKLYGEKHIYSKYTNNYEYRIPRHKLIPYICDKTGKQFYIKWKTLSKTLDTPHYEIKKGRKALTNEQILFIINNYPTYGRKYCSKHLNLSPGVITKYIKKHSLGKIHEIFPENHQKCNKCNEIFHFENFNLCYKSKSGYQSTCKKCIKKYRENKRNIMKNSNEEQRKILCFKQILAGIRHRCNKKGWKYDLDIDFILSIAPNICPIFGIKFTFLENKNNEQLWSSPSIDRIDNNKHYLKDNVIVISRRANTIKNCSNLEELRKLSEFYTNLEKNRNTDLKQMAFNF